MTTFIGKFHPDPELTAPLPSWMQPPYLEVTALEITQVIQCMHNLQCSDNSVPLYSGKLTMVRAYVRIKGGPWSFMSNIGGALCYGNTGANGCLNPIRPLYKINVWDNGGIDEVGLDVLHRRIYEPYWAYDYLGYCGGATNSWTSMYTYEAMAGKLPAGASNPATGRVAAPLSADAMVLVGSGEVSPEAALLEHGFYRLMSGLSMEETPDEDPYGVDLLDSGGQVLASRRFRPLLMSNSEPSASGPFNLILPWTDGTASVVFRYQGREIGRVEASRHARQISFVSPAEGPAWDASGLQTLAWTASDADDRPLQYFLQYSTDGGQLWSALAPNLNDTSFEVDTTTLPGSQDARLRLIASDGLNTTQVDSAPIQVGGKSPDVHISGPTTDDELISGSTAVLQGAATDLEDGFLGGDSPSWASDRDGVLGTGRTALLPSLSEGQHALTLTAVDSDGNAATATVDIVVGPPQTVEVPQGGGASLLPCLAGAVAPVLAAIGGAFVIGRRSRRGPSPKED